MQTSTPVSDLEERVGRCGLRSLVYPDHSLTRLPTRRRGSVVATRDLCMASILQLMRSMLPILPCRVSWGGPRRFLVPHLPLTPTSILQITYSTGYAQPQAQYLPVDPSHFFRYQIRALRARPFLRLLQSLHARARVE